MIHMAYVKPNQGLVDFPEAMLRLDRVKLITGLSRSQIYHRIEQGRFPRPVQLGEKAVAWRQTEIIEWMEALPTQPAPEGKRTAIRDRGRANRNS